MRILLFIIVSVLLISCRSNRNTQNNVNQMINLVEEIGKIKYQILIMENYPDLDIDYKKLDSLYYKKQ